MVRNGKQGFHSVCYSRYKNETCSPQIPGTAAFLSSPATQQQPPVPSLQEQPVGHQESPYELHYQAGKEEGARNADSKFSM